MEVKWKFKPQSQNSDLLEAPASASHRKRVVLVYDHLLLCPRVSLLAKEAPISGYIKKGMFHSSDYVGDDTPNSPSTAYLR